MKESNWVKIAENTDSLQWNAKGIALVSIQNKNICIIKTPEGIRACTERCPHAGTSLTSGFVDQHSNIICSAHHYKFNLNTGRDAFNEGYFLKTYPVKIEPDGVYLNFV